MKICNILTEAYPVSTKSYANNLAVFVQDYFYVVEDVPAITIEQFYELCKLSGLSREHYDGNVAVYPELLQMCSPDGIDKELKWRDNNFRLLHQSPTTEVITWNKLVRRVKNIISTDDELQ